MANFPNIVKVVYFLVVRTASLQNWKAVTSNLVDALRY